MAASPRILIAHDGSASADAAMADLARAGLPAKAQARILSAADVALPRLAFLPGEADAWYAQSLAALEQQGRLAKRKAEVTARKAAQTLRKLFPEWSVTTEAVEKDPAEAILNAATRWKPTLIVVGSHGRNVVDRLLLGSVSRRVLVHAPGDVRVSRRPGGRARKGPPRILIATDGSRHSRAAARAAVERAWPEGAVFRVLVVADYRVAFALEAPGESSGRRAWKKLAARIAEEPLEALAKRGFAADLVVREGDPRQEIIAEAKRFRAEALFVGSHGHGALRRFLLGSTSLNAAERAPCTVEVVKSGGRRKPRKTTRALE